MLLHRRIVVIVASFLLGACGTPEGTQPSATPAASPSVAAANSPSPAALTSPNPSATLDYQASAFDVVRQIATALQPIDALFFQEPPTFGDAEWQANAGPALDAADAAFERVRTLSPPPDMQERHDALVSALALCEEATGLLRESLDTQSTATVDEANAKMEQCGDQLPQDFFEE